MLKINWFTKFLMRFAPKTFLRYAAEEQGVNPKKISQAMKLFGKCKRIDIFPCQAGRGFIVILDRKLSLHFYQDGDHFCYDGFEVGEYEKGDVTIFDDIKR